MRLAFDSRALDYLELPSDLVDRVLDASGKLRAPYAARGVQAPRITQPSLRYTYFNMEDPVVGGYTKDKIALRRAISMAYNTEEEIRVVRQGQAEPATQPVPPNVTGYNPKLSGHVRYDPAGAKALLDKFGYVDRDGDGRRDLPDGKPLTLTIASPPSAVDRYIRSATGLRQSGTESIASNPCLMPKRHPRFPELQSVSHPEVLTIVKDLRKSSSP